MNALPPAKRQDLLSVVTTEHFTLQGARATAISDANGRTGFFLATLSAVVVALAFVAQLSGGLGDAFLLFAAILLPLLLFIGLATFERLLQLAIENIHCVVAINRLRHYYLEIAPELSAHITLSPFDDMAGVLASVGSVRRRLRPWDLVISNAGLIGVVDALLAGIVAGLATWAVTKDMAVIAAVAIVVGVVVLVLLLRYARSSLREANAAIGVRFASGSGIDTSHARISPEQPDATEATEANTV
jgi:hypothetical protein